MRSWNAPRMVPLEGAGRVPHIFNTPTAQISALKAGSPAQLYVCGITPYDATHIGHANTYLAYDTLNRVLRDAGLDVSYVQNVTDVDDPLLERATATGVRWSDLAESQIELFRGDMEALNIIPPEHYVGVVESVQLIGEACARLLAEGYAYWVKSEDAAPDLYFDISAAEKLTPWQLGQVSNLNRSVMLQLSSERGGDPERAGKRDPLDPLLWRAERVGEPAWESPIGRGRPGWHIECSVIGAQHLQPTITLNGGGSDLVFPHHELSAAHSAALSGVDWAHTYSHAGMVAYEGEKMSKSLGNLVLVSKLTEQGVDPRAIRLALLANHYRANWEWTADALSGAQLRLQSWIRWANTPNGNSTKLVEAIRGHLSNDLDAPAAIAEIDAAVSKDSTPGSQEIVAIESLLGVSLRA